VDPVGSGLAESLSRPGGNVTGFSLESTPQTNAKMIQLLSEAISGLTRVGVLWNSANPGSRVYLDAMREAAEPLGVILQVHDVRRAEDIDLAFHALKGNAEGLVVFPEPLMWTKRQHIVDMARAAGLPTIYGWRAATEIGGLMSYGPDLVDVFKRGAGYVDKVLKGAKPADLPIQQPTKFDLCHQSEHSEGARRGCALNDGGRRYRVAEWAWARGAPPRRLRSASGPGCVKTCTSKECAELFSRFSSFEGDCQCCSFPIQRN
jgi:ABC-type uncharacterized transport system substrate-binding protein